MKKISFTLVELLIVVSVIIVLISLLMPALGKARGKAQEIICLGNLKQSGLGILQYANDSNGWTPCSSRPWNSYQWGRWLISLDYLPGNDPDALLGKSRILVCPSLYPNGKYLNASCTYGFRRQGSSVTFFQLFKGPVSCMFYDSSANTYTPYTYSSMSNPADVDMLADSIRKVDPDPDRQWYHYDYGSAITSQKTFHTRHSKAANAWFADGHAGRISQSYLLEKGLKFFDANGNLL